MSEDQTNAMALLTRGIVVVDAGRTVEWKLLSAIG